MTQNPDILKRNLVSISGSLGGGDYPMGGLGIGFSHLLGPKAGTSLGFLAQYFGTTSNGSEYVDEVQVFPLMLDFRQAINPGKEGKFSTWVFVEGGYVISITGNERDSDGEFEYQNGWGFSPGISFKYQAFKKAGICLDLGFMRHTSRLKWLPPSEKTGHKAWGLGFARFSFFF